MSNDKFIFLDTWVLSDYTHGERLARLSEFINREGLTIVVTSLSMTELYNPNGQPGDRVSRAAGFLAGHRCVIVDPHSVFRAELQSYPKPLSGLPLKLDLNDVPIAHRARALELLLRRDEVYLRQGKDIAEWALGCEAFKAGWLETVDQIIEDACQGGVLSRDSRGRLLGLESFKEDFLTTLDRRHFGSLSGAEREALGVNVVHLFLGATRELPAIRLSSLCFGMLTYIRTRQIP
jgi:hypothetical protein